MTPDTERPERHVAVGVTREEAARSFALEHSDLLVTSFPDFAEEVDLEEVAVVEVVVGEGMSTTLRSVAAAQQADGGIDLRTTVPAADTGAYLALLQDLHLQITGVESRPGGPVLALGPRGSTRTGTDELVLSAVRAAAVALKDTESTEGLDGARPAERQPSSEDRPRTTGRARPVPRLVAVLGSVHRLRDGRRRRVVAATVAVVALLGVVGLGLLADSTGASLAVVLPVVVVTVAASAGLGCYLSLLLARQVDVQVGRVERMLLRNRAVVQKQGASTRKQVAALERRLRAVETGQSRFPFALEYLEALAELGAETSAQVRDLAGAAAARPDLHDSVRPHK